MNTEEKIEAASKKRSEGIALYKAQKYARASKRFEQVTRNFIYIFHPLHFNMMGQLSLWYMAYKPLGQIYIGPVSGTSVRGEGKMEHRERIS